VPNTKKGKSTAAEDRQGVAAVDRALSIVAGLEAAARPLTLAELARATGLYKSTLLRLLASLERSGLVMHRLDQRYSLGHFAFRLGKAFESAFRLEESVLPTLQWLVEHGTESASFHVRRDEDSRQCLLRVDSRHSVLDRLRAGDIFPVRKGAAGKILRAFAAGQSSAGPVPLVQTSFGERDPALAAVAVPVFAAGGELVGAISLSGPKDRFSRPALEKMAKLLLVAAERTTVAMGGHWTVPSSAVAKIAS
jgi:DNA-binding IclR family transcriptional regulator